MSTACGSDGEKSCITVCESDDDCASGHTCLPEKLCIAEGPAVQHCRGDQEIAPPLIDFWFGDPIVDRTVVDRSGNRIPARIQNDKRDPEGEGRVIANNLDNEFPALPQLQRSSPYTVDSWLYVKSVGKKIPVFTEEYPDGSFRTLLGLDSSGHLEVRLACDGSNRRSARSDVRVPRDQWTHVAAVVTGYWVFFYHDGEVVDVVRLNAPINACDPAEHYHFLYEEQGVADVRMYGLRFYDVRLPEAEVARLASLGRLSTSARCGDGIIDPEEQCDGQSACCARNCTLEPGGTNCGNNTERCFAGACVGQSIRTPDPKLLYEFNGSGDAVVADIGGLDLPLSIPGGSGSYDYSAVGVLNIMGSVLATVQIGQVLDECKTGGMSIEVTMVEGAALAEGPARIVSLNDDPGGGNAVFDLGPHEGHYVFRLAGGFSNNFGLPSLVSPLGDAQDGKRTHLVVTADPGGERIMYIDGVRRAGIRQTSGIDDWEATLPLNLANVAACASDQNRCRDWQGSLDTVAIYCRPLTEVEVGNNFAVELGLATP